MMNIDDLLQFRLDNHLCTYCGQDNLPQDEDRTTCVLCCLKLEAEAKEYWTKVYKAEQN